MTTEYMTINKVAPQFIILSKDGKIRINTYDKQVIGEWKKQEPRKEYITFHKPSRYIYECAKIYTEKLYTADVPYFGSFTAYSRKELKDILVNQINIKGLTIKK